MFEITYQIGFSAAHYLPGHPKCGTMHGHNYVVFVTLQAERLNRQQGMVMDFADLKAVLEPLLPDHLCLNDEFDFIPTAENLAEYFYFWLNTTIPTSVKLVKVKVQETDKASATYYE